MRLRANRKETPYIQLSAPYKVGNHWFINIQTLDGYKTFIHYTEDEEEDK